jgi:hypothetical protein
MHGFVSTSRRRGYALLPVPRAVEMGDGAVDIARLAREPTLSGLEPGDIAVRTLCDTLAARRDAVEGAGVPVELIFAPGAVDTDTGDGRHEQAYRIEITPHKVMLAGNGRPGLLYAVQTLCQLADHPSGALPLCAIVDWPEYEIRCIHWDTKHHQDRMCTLKRFLDQAAALKINAVLFELEDKFEYPSHPAIGAPGAFTTAELQELTDYALERHIQLIPDVQAPAHLCYVLKHDEFAHLRCDGSNYQICMDKPEARKLLFDMYDDVCAATEGAQYFHVSTDEVYYAGICETALKPYNPENRSLTWVDYVKAAHAHLSERGRKVIIWLEYPFLPEHTELLPPDLLNGIGGNDERLAVEEDRRGIRQFQYVSMQGSERLFPNYFSWTDGDGQVKLGRIHDAIGAISTGQERLHNAIGTISAAWDDSGLHNEAFWLGWAMTGQAAWCPGTSAEEAVASFMDVFYGRGAIGMAEVYRGLQSGARFHEQALESFPSTVRPAPRYGYSGGKQPIPNVDKTLLPPGLPDTEDLSFEPVFSERYAQAIAKAGRQLQENDRLLSRLQENLVCAERNTYSIEVLLSIARYLRHFIELILALASAEGLLVAASGAAAEGDPRRAIKHALAARDRAKESIADLYATYDSLKTTWEESRYEKGRSVGGRTFLHVMDDVKDHVADRRPDLTYLLEAEELIGLPNWVQALENAIGAYAAKHGVGVVLREAEIMDE